MTYFHVIGTLANSAEPACLFKDLTVDDLRLKFLRPYETGQDFLAGNAVVSPKDIRTIRIIETHRDDQTERNEINARRRARVGELNRNSGAVFFVSLGSGHDPKDIVEAGEDVTLIYIKGPPGYRGSTPIRDTPVFSKPWHENSLVRAALAVVSAIVAGGIIYAFGWN